MPAPGPGHHRDDRPHADGQRDRRRPHHPGRHAPRRHRAQLRHRPGRNGRAPALPERPQPGARSRACPTPGCPRWSKARCTTTSPPTSWPSTTAGSSPSSASTSSAGAAGRRPAHLKAVVDALSGLTPGPPGPGVGTGLRLALHPRSLRPGPVGPHYRRAHERQRLQAVPGGHAGQGLGHLHGAWPRRRSGPAAMCSMSASITPGKTAWPT